MLYNIKKNCISIINKLSPKKNCIYLFSTFLYKDNIQAILDELLRQGINKKYVIYCDGPAFADYSAENIYHVSHGSIKSIISFSKSRYVFFDIGIYGQIAGGRNQVLVNTWHGTSLKKIEYYLEKNKRKGMPPLCTYSIAYSDYFKPIIKNAFGLDDKHVLVTGEPRNDYLFSEDRLEILKKLGISEKRKIVIWMPTWRQNKERIEENDGANYEFGIPFLNIDTLRVLNDTCLNNNTMLIIKWHGLQQSVAINEDDYPAIKFLTSETVALTKCPLYYLVGCCDALITDYSSIYVNYLVLNRPICFAYDDIDEYKSNRGFMFDDVENIMPGIHVNSVEGIINFIIAINNNAVLEADNSRRKEVGLLLNKYSDNQNSFRLLKELGIIS